MQLILREPSEHDFNPWCLTVVYIYRPQTKFAKVMFLHLSVSHSVHGGCLPHPPEQTSPPPGTDTPRSRHAPRSRHHPRSRHTPQEQTPPLEQTPPHSACWEIRATSGQYASYWNAYLFYLKLQ